MNIKALGTALKNKVTDKVGSAMAAPYVKYQEAKSRVSDREYNFAKDYNAKKKSGIAPSDKDQAIIQAMKDRSYGK